MNLKDLKIGVRLGVGFGILCLILLGFSVLVVARLHEINDRIDSMVNDKYVKADLAGDIQNQMNVQARHLRNAIIGAKDPSEVQTSLSKVDEASKANDAMLSKLESMINTPKGRELFDQLKKDRAAFAAVRSKLIDLLKAGQVEDAGAFLLKDVRPPQDAFLKSLDAMNQFQQGMMEKEGKTAMLEGEQAVKVTWGVVVVALILSVFIGFWVTRSITGPVNDAVQVASSVAEGDLTRVIQVNSHDEMGQLLSALKSMQDGLSKVVGQVRNGSEAVATASSQIAQGNTDLSSRTEEQASSLEETAASMEQLGSTVKQNADNARQANQLAQSASGAAVKGGDVVSQVVGTMKTINESSRQMADIVSTIDSIAFQTNILALNAAVEAARAGEQGRGFAVVAGEVRSLAGRSAQAAKEIKTLIAANVERVERGSLYADQAGAAMDEIVSSIQRVTDIMGEISAASSEQSQGVGQISEAMSQMDQVTQQNAAMVEEMAAAASSLSSQANELVRAVAFFKLSHSGGVSEVRHAPPTRHSPRPAVAPKVAKPVVKVATAPKAPALALVGHDTGKGDWESF